MTCNGGSPKVLGVAVTCATHCVPFHPTGKRLMASSARFVDGVYKPEHNVSGRVCVTLKGSTQCTPFRDPKGSGSTTLTGC